MAKLTPSCGKHCVRYTYKTDPQTTREYHCRKKCCHGNGGKAKKRKRIW